MLKEFKAKDYLIKLPADKRTATVIEHEHTFVWKEQIKSMIWT